MARLLCCQCINCLLMAITRLLRLLKLGMHMLQSDNDLRQLLAPLRLPCLRLILNALDTLQPIVQQLNLRRPTALLLCYHLQALLQTCILLLRLRSIRLGSMRQFHLPPQLCNPFWPSALQFPHTCRHLINTLIQLRTGIDTRRFRVTYRRCRALLQQLYRLVHTTPPGP